MVSLLLSQISSPGWLQENLSPRETPGLWKVGEGREHSSLKAILVRYGRRMRWMMGSSPWHVFFPTAALPGGAAQ